jgi:hypothetical protein
LHGVELVLHRLESVQVEQRRVDGDGGIGRRDGLHDAEPIESSDRVPRVGGILLIAADNQVGTLVGSFLVALVIVSPFAYRQVRKVQRNRARLVAPPTGPIEADDTTQAEDTDLVGVAARIATDAASREPGVDFWVSVPSVATLGGRPADRAIVESILADGLRRDGIRIVERQADTWRCRRA